MQSFSLCILISVVYKVYKVLLIFKSVIFRLIQTAWFFLKLFLLLSRCSKIARNSFLRSKFHCQNKSRPCSFFTNFYSRKSFLFFLRHTHLSTAHINSKQSLKWKFNQAIRFNVSAIFSSPFNSSTKKSLIPTTSGI